MAPLALVIAIATAFLMPGAAVVAPLFLAPLAGFAGAVAVVALIRSRTLAALPWRVALPMLLLLAWAATSAPWAIEPAHAAMTTARLVVSTLLGLAVVGGASLLDDRHDRLVARVLLIGTLVALALLLAEYLSGNRASALLSIVKGQEPFPPGYKSPFNRGATVLAMLVWPLAALAAAQAGRAIAAGLVVAVAATLALGDSHSARIAFVAGGMVFAIAAVGGRGVVIVLRACVIAWVAVLPLALTHIPPPPRSLELYPWLPGSGHARLAIWHFTLEAIAHHPVTGWGMDSSRSLPGGNEMFDFPWVVDGTDKGSLTGEWMPLHPHNAALQWWVELGLPGVLAMAAMMWALVGRIGALPRARPAAAAAMGSAMAISAISYGFWQGWWQAALWMVAAICLLAARAPTRSSGDATP